LSTGQKESDESTLKIQVRSVDNKGAPPASKSPGKKKKKATTKKPSIKKSQDSNKPSAGTN